MKIRIAVAAADAVVSEGCGIDGHARTNTTSLYAAAAEVFPMLLEKLSTGPTSLGEGRACLAIVIEMDLAADGTVAPGLRAST